MKPRAILRFLVPVLLCVGLALPLSGCRESGGDEQLFGDNVKDTSDVVCRVDGVAITTHDMELRLAEMPEGMRAHYSGEDMQKPLLKLMIGEVLMAHRAEQSGVQHEPAVAQQIISTHRDALVQGFQKYVLEKDLQPTEEQIRDYYQGNLDKFAVAGSVKARHIQCRTKKDADAAWARLHGTGKESAFPYVVSAFSCNEKTAANSGDIGWFNKGGYVAYVPDGKEFTEKVYDFDVGLNPPVKIGDYWQIVEILDREPARTLGLREVRDKIIKDMEPLMARDAREDFVNKAMQEAGVQYYGDFQPGHGRTAAELLKLGMLSNDYDRQDELFDELLSDYPDSPEAPVALFMKANIHIDRTGDINRARMYLQQLLQRYPDSEVADQAQYMLDNLGKANFNTPRSIEELKQLPH